MKIWNTFIEKINILFLRFPVDFNFFRQIDLDLFNITFDFDWRKFSISIVFNFWAVFVPVLNLFLGSSLVAFASSKTFFLAVGYIKTELRTLIFWVLLFFSFWCRAWWLDPTLERQSSIAGIQIRLLQNFEFKPNFLL